MMDNLRIGVACAFAAAGFLATACGPEPLVIEEGCSPLLHGVDCGLPYPSDFFLVDDPSTPTGKRVELPPPARMVAANGTSADVSDVWAPDGFSRLPPIVLSFGVRVDPTSLPGILDDPAATVAKGFHTALLEADTGRRVAHFIDVDPRAIDDAREALILQPIEPLRARTRYIVALTGVAAKAGGVIEPPEAFKRLRDAWVGDDKLLKPLLERYEREVFPVLTEDGLERGALQLAWDFTTGSEEHPIADMLASRAVGMAALDDTPPVIEVEAVFEGDTLAQLLQQDAANTWRLVKGYVTGPRVVDSDQPGAMLARADDGSVRLDGTTRFPFTAILPMSVKEATAPASVLLYGHGFFGMRTEIMAASSRAVLEHAGVVGIAIEWQGMSEDDIGTVVGTVGGDVAQSLTFGERVMQAMVNWNAVTRALDLGLFSREPAFQRGAGGDPAVDPAAPVIDVDKPLGFLGISMGHILGGTLSALNPDIERSVLMVGGAAFSAMMFRARPFERFLFLLDLSLPDPFDQRKLTAHMQAQFDRFDPFAFARYVVQEDLPTGPANGHSRRRVLEMYGVADAQVPNLGSEIHARALGIPLLGPSPVPPLYGVEQREGPIEGSAVAVYDFGFDPGFYAQAEPVKDGNIVHEGVRLVPEAQEQMRVFLSEGRVENFCDGACVVDPSRLGLSD